MKIFLVGGAVRDTLLGLPIKDKDWVVVGSTPQQMINAGYQQVGHNFPVFLHPYSHEEYALARTEQKSNFGYTGFCCSTINIELEQDLLRRDLTINSLAQDDKGRIINTCGGLADLQNRILRHTSPAFIEDPLRVLRVARFAARYAHLNFHIADETMELMQKMTERGELVHLKPERIWKETENALATYNPQIYFEILHNCGALKILFPEIDTLFNISETGKKHHINVGIHTMLTLNMAATLSQEIDVRFAALCHDLGKILTTKQIWPNCYEYGALMSSTKLIEQICNRLRIPNKICELAKIAAKFHILIHSIKNLDPINIIKIFNNIDVWRKPERIKQIALISEANARGYENSEIKNYQPSTLLYEIWQVINTISVKEVIKDGFKGSGINRELTKRRIQAIVKWKNKIIT